jgi:hypothetical protein
VLFGTLHRRRSRALDRETACVEVDLWPSGTRTRPSFSEPEPGKTQPTPKHLFGGTGQEGSATRSGPTPTNGCGAP